MTEWLTQNWLSLTAPAIVFLASVVVAIWVRRTRKMGLLVKKEGRYGKRRLKNKTG